MVKQFSPTETLITEAPDEIPSDEELKTTADRLYATYVKPLEGDHWGRLAIVSPDGRMLVGDVSYDLTRQASDQFGPGNFLFKIGDRAVHRLGPRRHIRSR